MQLKSQKILPLEQLNDWWALWNLMSREAQDKKIYLWKAHFSQNSPLGLRGFIKRTIQKMITRMEIKADGGSMTQVRRKQTRMEKAEYVEKNCRFETRSHAKGRWRWWKFIHANQYKYEKDDTSRHLAGGCSNHTSGIHFLMWIFLRLYQRCN